MVQELRHIDVSRNNPDFHIKSLPDGFLLTPKDKQSPPYMKLIIANFACIDTNGQILNGAAPMPLTSKEAQLIARDIGFDLKGIPLSVLYLQPDAVTNNKSAMHVVSPKQATHFLLCTKWVQTSKYAGADRQYASKQRGVVKFNKDTAPDSKDGKDFWRIKVKGVLSEVTIKRLHRSWATRLESILNDHLTHHPGDFNLVKSCRKRLGLDQDDDSATDNITTNNDRTTIAS